MNMGQACLAVLAAVALALILLGPVRIRRAAGVIAAIPRRWPDLSGIDFDRRFLMMMISHHQGAIEMAKTEHPLGSSSEAKDLAAKIASAQTAEIATMQTLLTQF